MARVPLPSCHCPWAQQPQGAPERGVLRDNAGDGRALPPILRVEVGARAHGHSAPRPPPDT